jgi:arginine-tRNA-protein transferase
VILDHIDIAREAGLPHVYLGYWVPGSVKMGYKSNFSGLEVFRGGAWEAFQGDEAYDAQLHPLSTDPIAEQVANISLPDLSHPVKRT